jgi:hypothetical protein
MDWQDSNHATCIFCVVHVDLFTDSPSYILKPVLSHNISTFYCCDWVINNLLVQDMTYSADKFLIYMALFQAGSLTVTFIKCIIPQTSAEVLYLPDSDVKLSIKFTTSCMQWNWTPLIPKPEMAHDLKLLKTLFSGNNVKPNNACVLELSLF